MVATDALPVRPYVTRLTRESLDERDGHRAMKIVAFSLAFSKQGAAELEAFHEEVMSGLKLAFSVFMSGDVRIARQLIAEKATLRASELAAAESHLARLRERRLESVESSSLHLDVLRDLKRIHSHICSVAYPVLERAGALRPSRLRLIEPTDVPPTRRIPPPQGKLTPRANQLEAAKPELMERVQP